MKKSKVDALVIGSGVGGLCTAARLAVKGLKVKVIEKLPYLGGRFSSRNYQGFQVSTGAMMVPFGVGSSFQEAFKMVDAAMNMREVESGFRFRLDHGDFDMPIRKGDLAGMLQFAMGDSDEANEMLAHFIRALLWTPPEDTISVREWLAQYTDNDGIQKLYQGFCGAFQGINSHEVPASEIFLQMKAMLKGKHYGIAVNGNIDLMNSLANGIRDQGAEIQASAACKEILVEQNTVKGAVVETKDGMEAIEAEYVVSNMGPVLTVKLAGEAAFEQSYLKRLKDYNFITPVVHVCIASKEPLSDFDGIINFCNTRRLVYFETPTLTCPELAPEGMHFATTYSVPRYTTGPLQLKETIDMVMLDLADNFPAFKDAKPLMIATHHKQWPAMRRWPGYPMPMKTPIQNLYNVGDGCMPKGTVGIEASALSARPVAQDIAG